ncbi:MAG: hypothetical protein ACWGNK_08760 [Desulfobacterales bacterium]
MKERTVFGIALVVAIAVDFTITASANEWKLYGSVRMGTFWTSQDYGELYKSNANPSEDDVFGRSGVQNLQWNLQSNSRIGATVKGDKLDGRIEVDVNDDPTGGGNVTTRRIYGVWNFADGWGLKIGKDYTPITFFLSNQVFDNDNDLRWVGNAYGARYGQIALEGKGVKLAAITSSPTAVDNFAGTVADATTESKIPKFEASYQFNFTDAMSVHAFGGWQYYDLFWLNPVSAAGQEENVTSYMFGVGADLNFGPFFVKPQVSYYTNGAVAGWLNTNLGLNSSLPQQTPFINATGNGIVDIKSLMAMLAVGFTPSGSVGLETGAGYLKSESDDFRLADGHGVSFKNTYLEYYLQAAITVAKGVYVIPEVGIRDYGKLEGSPAEPNRDLGGLFYAGAKWQIDF